VPVLTSRTVVKTVVHIRIQARRFDCSFVFAVPVQTSVGKIQSVVVVRESGSASALPNRRRLFRTISCGNSIPHLSIVFSARQHSPCDPRSVSLDTQHACAVNQNLTQVDVAALTDAEQFCFTSSRVLAWHDTQPMAATHLRRQVRLGVLQNVRMAALRFAGLCAKTIQRSSRNEAG
jgi:hypothetical protein